MAWTGLMRLRVETGGRADSCEHGNEYSGCIKCG